MAFSTKGGILSLAIVAILVLAASLVFLGWGDGGKIDRDMVLFLGLFFAIPVLFGSGLLLVASIMGVRGNKWFVIPGVDPFRRPVAGRCNYCLCDITTEDLHCPGCGRSLSNRWVSANMRTANARESEEAETERIRLELRLRRHPLALAAGQKLVELTVPPLPDPEAAIQQCLREPQAIQNLHRSAARRLHPDQNHGQHLDDWFILQDSVSTLQAFHDLSDSPATTRVH